MHDLPASVERVILEWVQSVQSICGWPWCSLTAFCLEHKATISRSSQRECAEMAIHVAFAGGWFMPVWPASLVDCQLAISQSCANTATCRSGVLSLVLTSADVFHTLRLVLAARQSDSRGTTGRESRLYSFASSSGAFCMVLNAEESESLAGETRVPRSTWLQ